MFAGLLREFSMDRLPETAMLSPAHRTAPQAEPAARRWIAAALTALLVLNLAFLVFYTFVTYRLQFHSDTAGKNLFAQEMLDAGSFLPRDYAYGNGDLIVFGGHLVIAPLLPFFPNGFALHAVSSIVFSAALLACAWWFTGLIGLSRVSRLLALCLLASGISRFMAENLYGQIAYGSLVLMMLLQGCLAMALYEAWRRRQTTRVAAACAGLFVAALLSFLSNPVRSIVTFVVPLATAIVALAFWSMRGATMPRDPLRARRDLILGAVAYGAGALLGTIGYVHVLRQSIVFSANAKRHFLALDTLGDRLILAIKSLMFLFGVEAQAGASVMSPAGVEAFLRLVLLCSVVAAGFALAARPLAERRGAARQHALSTAFIVSLLLVAFLYVFTDLSENISTSRYFIPAFALGLVALPCWLEGRVMQRRYDVWLVAAVVATVGVSMASYRPYVLPLRDYYRAHAWDGHLPQSAHDRLVRFLEDNGLTYGYASYWDASVNTVLSAGAVTIRAVIFQGGLPRPMIHLAAARWYTADAHRGPTFLLVRKDEAKDVDLPRLREALGPEARTLTFEDFTIHVFPHNFQDGLFAWDILVPQPTREAFTRHTPRNAGRYVEDPPGDGWIEAREGEAGALAYGPYIALPKGRYVARFEVAGCGTAVEPSGTVDVTAFVDGGPTVLAQSVLRPESAWQNVDVPFELAKGMVGMEFRVISNGRGCVRARGITLQHAAVSSVARR